MTRYVVGLLFSERWYDVLLIRKNRPVWQAGKLNGIGGKIEGSETPLESMCREFREETGLEINDWSHFMHMGGSNDDGRGFTVDFFAAMRSLAELHKAESTTDELVDVYPTAPLSSWHDVIDNLRWIVPLAIDHLSDGRPSFVNAEYNPPI